jgi:hypothetical protein
LAVDFIARRGSPEAVAQAWEALKDEKDPVIAQRVQDGVTRAAHHPKLTPVFVDLLSRYELSDMFCGDKGWPAAQASIQHQVGAAVPVLCKIITASMQEEGVDEKVYARMCAYLKAHYLRPFGADEDCAFSEFIPEYKKEVLHMLNSLLALENRIKDGDLIDAIKERKRQIEAIR